MLRPAERSVRGRLALGDTPAAVVAAGLAILVGLLIAPRGDRVDLEVVNPTKYEITVEVSDQPDGSRTRVTTLAPGVTRTVFEVADQGDTWVFLFTGQGKDGGVLTVSAADLAASGWRLEIPVDVGEALAQQGAPLS